MCKTKETPCHDAHYDYQVQNQDQRPVIRPNLKVYHCPYCPEYFALDVYQIDHHI
ncbi:hypothetical protein GGF37_005894, partial [Kickxella alabastrina]